ncbi:hypothetical protein Tco_0039122 [Tanacetum coccineum]
MVELMVVVQIQVADLEIQEVVVRHVVVEMDLKGPVVNYPSLTHKGYLVTFIVDEVLERWILMELVVVKVISFYEVVKEFSHFGVPYLKM